VDVIGNCKFLEALIMVNATRTKETAVPREYAFKVCKVLRNLASVDGLKNPFGTIRPPKNKLPAMMKIAESMQSDQLAAVQQEETETSMSPAVPANNNQSPGERRRYTKLTSFINSVSTVYDLYDLSNVYKNVQNIGTEASWEILYRPRTETDTPPSNPRDSTTFVRYG
jgi:hypothetical protein